MEALTTTGNDRIKPGGNNPPAFDAHAANIADIREEAGAWLTGETIKSAEEAEAVKLLLDMARKAAKAADDERASEKEPHLTASKAVDAKWKPLITSAQTMADVCKEILTPWNIAEAARKEAEAAVARAAAEAERQAEVEATRAAAGNIDAREQADQLAASAKQAETIAKRAERAAGTGLGLRTTYRAEVTDFTAAARAFWTSHRDRFEALTLTIAQEQVRAGKRDIPGITVIEERKAI
tara:strand:+ start:8285 stop:9001 length:717 start_codon:yes stop_codon:yes gene_type:complete